MRNSTRSRALDRLMIAPVPLLDASDLPGDDAWSLPDDFASDDSPDEDRFATLALPRAFDD